MDPHSKETQNQNNKNEFPFPSLKKLKNLSRTLTELELRNEKIMATNLKNIKLPESLEILILTNNNITELPESVTNLRNLKKLDVSYNNIHYFDCSPKFSQSIEHLDMSNNNLKGPPYWLWSGNPQNLRYLNISVNEDITHSLSGVYFQELIQYTSLVTHLDIHNCKFHKYLELIRTFCQLKSLKMGSNDFIFSKVNFIEKFPKEGLDKCYDIEVVDLSNTKIYSIDTNINIYQNLTDLNLSINNISYLPNQICQLEKLEFCAISFNKLSSLPDGLEKLRNLKRLYLDHNQLSMLPENLGELTKLETLDLYSNCLYEVPDIQHLLEIDAAQNYCEEPNYPEYGNKKDKLREKLDLAETRLDGRAPKVEDSEEEYYSSQYSDDECNSNEDGDKTKEWLSAPLEMEDWDSDEYWVPQPIRIYSRPIQSPGLWFFKQKIREGDFCPRLVPISIGDKVKYEKMGTPKFRVEVIGQFDDL